MLCVGHELFCEMREKKRKYRHKNHIAFIDAKKGSVSNESYKIDYRTIKKTE